MHEALLFRDRLVSEFLKEFEDYKTLKSRLDLLQKENRTLKQDIRDTKAKLDQVSKEKKKVDPAQQSAMLSKCVFCFGVAPFLEDLAHCLFLFLSFFLSFFLSGEKRSSATWRQETSSCEMLFRLAKSFSYSVFLCALILPSPPRSELGP